MILTIKIETMALATRWNQKSIIDSNSSRNRDRSRILKPKYPISTLLETKTQIFNIHLSENPHIQYPQYPPPGPMISHGVVTGVRFYTAWPLIMYWVWSAIPLYGINRSLPCTRYEGNEEAKESAINRRSSIELLPRADLKTSALKNLFSGAKKRIWDLKREVVGLYSFQKKIKMGAKYG